jgi:hypothetical protein
LEELEATVFSVQLRQTQAEMAVATDSVVVVLVVLAAAVVVMVSEGLAPQDRVKTVVIVLGNLVALAVAVLAV